MQHSLKRQSEVQKLQHQYSYERKNKHHWVPFLFLPISLRKLFYSGINKQTSLCIELNHVSITIAMSALRDLKSNR
jgi:hypothetical protein